MISNSTSSKLSYIEKLPTEIIGNILVQLVDITGSKGILNKKDIPVIIKYRNRLAASSRVMYKKVNCQHLTNLFLKSMSQKFETTPEEIAAKLNTTAARIWLWDYIKRVGDDKSYDAIQHIYKLVEDAKLEAKEAGLGFNFHFESDKPKPYLIQTKTGFLIYFTNGPSSLATPFGEIKINHLSSYHFYEVGSSQWYALASVSELFINKLNAIFVEVTGKLDANAKLGKVNSLTNFSKIRKISLDDFEALNKNELEKNIGSSSLIVSYDCNSSSVYQIQTVNGSQISPYTMHDGISSKRRSNKLVKVLWEMLENNRLKKDPINKIIGPNIEPDESNKIIKHSFKTSAEIASWAIDTIKQMSKQPILIRDLFQIGEKKVMMQDGNLYGGALGLLTESANKYFQDPYTHWDIDSYPLGEDSETSIEDKETSIMLYPRSDSCDLKAFEEAYLKVFQSLRSNWERAELKNHPDILHLESEEEYALYIQKSNEVTDKLTDDLVRVIAQLLGISNFINCQKARKGDNNLLNPAYLWIRKDALKEVNEKLQLNLFQQV